MAQTRVLFCMCDSGVARCQSQHQCHFWQMNSMFEAYCMGKFISFIIRGYEQLQKSKDSLKDCFEMYIYEYELSCLLGDNIPWQVGFKTGTFWSRVWHSTI